MLAFRTKGSLSAYDGGIEHLHKMRRLAQCRQGIEESFESSGPAQAPEPLPGTVPMPKLFRESPPSDTNSAGLREGAREEAFKKAKALLGGKL
jgi:hypothetical protein